MSPTEQQRLPCTQCGAMILPITAETYGGLCARCFKEASSKNATETASSPPGLSRVPCPTPPSYDIDDLLRADWTHGETAQDLVEKVYEALEDVGPGEAFYYRPDSILFPPEIVVRDMTNFNMSMLSGFESSLGYGGGFTVFFRALRALRELQHEKGLALAERVREVMVANGAREPVRFEDDVREGTDANDDWDRLYDEVPDFLDRVGRETRPLDSAWWDLCGPAGEDGREDPNHPSLHYAICACLESQRELLRGRRAAT